VKKFSLTIMQAVSFLDDAVLVTGPTSGAVPST
jgi:hypothetical protein